MLIQHAPTAGSGALAGTAAEWLWVVPLLPLLGFVINGALSIIPATRLGPADPSAHGHDVPEGHGTAAPHDAGHGASGPPSTL